MIGAVFQRALQPFGFEPTTGILLFNSFEEDFLVIAIMDDLSETVDRIVRWADAAYQQALEVVAENQIIIATSGTGRAEELQAISRYKVLNVEADTKPTAQEAGRKSQIKKKRPRKRRGQPSRHSR